MLTTALSTCKSVVAIETVNTTLYARRYVSLHCAFQWSIWVPLIEAVAEAQARSSQGGHLRFTSQGGEG